MALHRLLFLGDTVGTVGVDAAAHAMRTVEADTFVVNGENARNGSGLSPTLYRKLREAGAHAITLGDHCYRDVRIIDALQDDDQPICRPANLGPRARGKQFVRLDIGTPLIIVTVLGRRYMPPVADDPFHTLDTVLSGIDEPALVLVEIHAEATSEKQAIAYHGAKRWTDPAGPRVVAVVGTHTHVRTDDARIIDPGVAAITDVGMCAGHDGIIGRTTDASLRAFTNPTPTHLEIATADPRASGVLITIDTDARTAVAIEPVDIPMPS